MKVKKYVASSMPEAMKLIRAELGNDAVILNSKVVHSGGFLGFFKKKKIEVIAAVDPMPKNEQIPIVKQKTKYLPNAKNHLYEKQSTESKTGFKSELIKEISEIKELLKKNHSNFNENGIALPGPIQEASLLMEKQEIDKQIQTAVLEELIEKWYLTGACASKDEVLSWLRNYISNRIANLKYGGVTFTKQFVNVVGPTGVGKTTTLAKIAADCVLTYKKKAAFITTDTYRIAAIDQLKTYAKLLNAPLEVCYNMEDFQKAADQFAEYDIVFIDTAGRNFRNRGYVNDLKKTIDFDRDMETYLVLSLTSKQRDMEEIFEQFSLINIDRLIFTKADETSSFGAMLNIIDKYQTGVAYLTNGQNVPDDMLVATPTVISNLLFGVETDVRSS
ncbi:flagellar biosynthesis protein FlhF [Bacillus methanolicus]|uniref:Flagellar biosynthesis protein FlhF n=1 Tax=Bacillus methanolicus (strain MGA3 / ATCC 53907) TaxID=796606 RepID=I3DZC9_BACMM|nr:flagellar biosynthesis protein FlhF [Bacillus methanolicus]AIE59670.1 flagellar biosynthesis regulator FlhF [Bacillus methanolicus MGA3]EIJ79600.1 flagellar biosynthesis regulator FlhF [Bacillus methanolicus MGA3]